MSDDRTDGERITALEEQMKAITKSMDELTKAVRASDKHNQQKREETKAEISGIREDLAVTKATGKTALATSGAIFTGIGLVVGGLWTAFGEKIKSIVGFTQ